MQERRGRQERVGDGRVGPVQDDRSHLADDDLAGRQVAVLQARADRGRLEGAAGGLQVTDRVPDGRGRRRRASSSRGSSSASDPSEAAGTPATRAASRSAARTRWTSASRARVAVQGARSSVVSDRSGPVTCSMSTRPVAWSAAISGATNPGSTSPSRRVTAISWANTVGTCLAHTRPRSVSRVTSAARPHDRTWRTGPRRRSPASARAASIQDAIDVEPLGAVPRLERSVGRLERAGVDGPAQRGRPALEVVERHPATARTGPARLGAPPRRADGPNRPRPARPATRCAAPRRPARSPRAGRRRPA